MVVVLSVEPEKSGEPEIYELEEEIDDEKLLEEIEKADGIAFQYSPPERGHKEVFIIKDGKVVEPVERIRKKHGGYDVYSKDSLKDFDAALEVNMTKTGKHRCYVAVNNPKEESILKLLEIHDCEKVRKKLSKYLK